MRFQLLFMSSVSACFELENNAPYYASGAFHAVVNGVNQPEEHKTNVFSLYGLTPDTAYTIGTTLGDFTLELHTKGESACLNIMDFGAVADGVTDNTRAIQTAINACPRNGRVFVPAGVYKTSALILDSHLTLELAEGAVLLGSENPADYPVWPGEVSCGTGGEVLQCASWEGEPRACNQSFLSAHHKCDIMIIGKGVLDGNAQNSDWWIDHKKRPLGRPRMLFTNNCTEVYMHGVTVKNSPSWNLHPFFSQGLGFYDLKILAPADSPNTDGCNPESCDNVDIIGVRFSVGDDAIAIKSGKLYMGAKYKTPSSNIRIRNCLMEYAHGGVVLGSEMAGGVRDLDVRQCLFDHTDRGLRIKTRRGRGKDAVIDGVTFENIIMENVLTPLVINMYYHCDPDGKTEYVWTREPQPVDERTPFLGRFHFKNLTCNNCEYAAAYFDGLPEQPIGEVTIENVSFTVKPDAGAGYPAMMTHIDEHSKRGLIFKNVKNVKLKNVTVTGADGEEICTENVGELTREP